MAENRTTEQTPAIPDFIQRHIDNAESLFPGEPQAEIPLPPEVFPQSQALAIKSKRAQQGLLGGLRKMARF